MHGAGCRPVLLQDHHLLYGLIHQQLSEGLATRVVGPIAQYLPSVSPYIPHMHLTREEAASLCRSWSDVMWQQVCVMCDHSCFQASRGSCVVVMMACLLAGWTQNRAETLTAGLATRLSCSTPAQPVVASIMSRPCSPPFHS